MTQTQNIETGIDPMSGLKYIEATGSTDQVDWKIESIESDHATLDASISVGTVTELDAAIATLQALRTLVAQAETIRGEM
jgi:cbb3-type cytochrome oxidase cytochrome c subunit